MRKEKTKRRETVTSGSKSEEESDEKTSRK
jgi:hypothetical protein